MARYSRVCRSQKGSNSSFDFFHMKPPYHGLFNHGEFTDTCEGCSLSTLKMFAENFIDAFEKKVSAPKIGVCENIPTSF